MPNFINRSCSWPFLIFICTVISCCLGLSYWPVQRYQEKLTWVNLKKSNEQKAALRKLPEKLQQADEGRKFAIMASYRPNQYFLRANTYHNHKLGFLVYVPILSQKNWYLAEFGWLAQTGKLELPKSTKIKGYVTCAKGKEFRLKNIPPNPGWPKIIQTLDLKEINHITQKDFGKCWLNVKTKLPRVVKNRVMSPNRHLGYAAQWLLFAIIILYIFAKLTKDKSNAKT